MLELLKRIEQKTVILGVIGLGYVGLPLVVEFGKKYKVIGFDTNEERIEELKKGIDKTLEVTTEELKKANNLCLTSNVSDLQNTEIFIVTVPTPVDSFNRPDLSLLLRATETVGKILRKGNIVIYESTVYPGCTEEDCVPLLEKFSGLKFNEDFYCGYSPERINPGDKEHRLENIKKIVSGSTLEITKAIKILYSKIISAGTYEAPSIKVAEAAKVIENAQRDINIAFVNELAMLFDLMGIDTLDVLKAAETKWNFLPFRPGLVGGHCIGVDPYYLTHKAVHFGYNPEIILAGRRINDGMGTFVANKLVKQMIKKEIKINGANVLVLGITFKENCPDIRNSRVIDIIKELREFGCNIDVYDPWAESNEVKHKYGLELIKDVDINKYAGVIVAVAHNEFKGLDFLLMRKNGTVVFDVKGILKRELIDDRL